MEVPNSIKYLSIVSRYSMHIDLLIKAVNDVNILSFD